MALTTCTIDLRILPKIPAVPNHYKVQKKKWDKWTKNARGIFNAVYSAMTRNQELFNHPKAEKLPKAQWRTVAWNAAWLAADATLI